MGCLHISIEWVLFVPEQKIHVHSSIYSNRVCSGYPRQIRNFSRMHQPPPRPIFVVICVIYPKRPKLSIIMLCVGPDVDKPLRVKISRGPFSQKHLYKQATLQMCQRTALFRYPSNLSKRFNPERRRLHQLIRRHTLGFAPLKEILALRDQYCPLG